MTEPSDVAGASGEGARRAVAFATLGGVSEPGAPADPGSGAASPPPHADPVIAATLARLDAVDPAAASDARAALEWLIGDAGLGAVSRYGVQQFCWYELPFKWIIEPHVQAEIVSSLARFFDLAGLARYGEVCRSAVTGSVLEAWRHDPSAGFAAYRQASERSGVEPADLPELTWSGTMLEDEHTAFWSAAVALEMAVDAGALVPGSTGWRSRRGELTLAHLTHPRDELFGGSFLQAIHTARIGAWIEGPPGQASRARAQLLAPVANALLHPPAPPRDLRRSLAPLRWWLDQLVGEAGGLPLTGTGRLPRATVRAALDAFPRWPAAANRIPQRVDDLPALAAVDRLGRELRLARRQGRRLVITRLGEQCRADPRALWSAIAAHEAAGSGWPAAVAELVFAILLLEPLVERREVMAEVTVALTEAGWHRGVVGDPVPRARLEPAFADLVLRATTFGWVRERGPAANPVWRLTATGRSTAVAALRSRALAPNVM